MDGTFAVRFDGF